MRPSQPSRLQDVLRAGMAMQAREGKEARNDNSITGVDVLDNIDMINYVAMKIVANYVARKIETKSSSEDEDEDMDLCDNLINWCSQKRIPCLEDTFKAASTALGIDTEAKANFVMGKVKLVMHKVVPKDKDLRGPVSFWLRTFRTLCRIYGADKNAYFVTQWFEALKSSKKIGLPDRNKWMQLFLLAKNGYTAKPEILARLVSTVARANLGNSNEERNKFLHEYAGTMWQLQQAMVWSNEAEVQRIMENYTLSPSSMAIYQTEQGTVDAPTIDVKTIDHLSAQLCSDEIVFGPDDKIRISPNPVVKYIVGRDDYYALTFTKTNARPPLFYIAENMHVGYLKTFTLRLQHESADYVLQYHEPKTNVNILHLLMKYPPSPLQQGVATLDGEILWWKGKYDALEALIQRAELAELVKPGLIRRLRTEKRTPEDLNAVEIFDTTWNSWLETANNRFGNPLPQIVEDTGLDIRMLLATTS